MRKYWRCSLLHSTSASPTLISILYDLGEMPMVKLVLNLLILVVNLGEKKYLQPIRVFALSKYVHGISVKMI